MDNETRNLMLRGRDEIQNLRRENEVLRARVETFDACTMMLMAKPREFGATMGVDVAWEMDQLLAKAIPSGTPRPSNP